VGRQTRPTYSIRQYYYWAAEVKGLFGILGVDDVLDQGVLKAKKSRGLSKMEVTKQHI